MCPLQVLNITWTIYRNLPSISTEIALKSLKRALVVLTCKNPREVVASVLQCSPTCGRYGAQQPLGLLCHWDGGPKTLLRAFSPATLQGVPADRAPCPCSVAMAMWKAMLSEPRAAGKVLRQLLSAAMNQPLHKISIATLDNPRILSLAVSCSTRPCCPPRLLSAVRGSPSSSLPTPSADLLRDERTSQSLGVFCRQPG